MRYIDLSELNLPPDWEDRAKKVMDKLNAATPEKRNKIINANQELWKELKDALSKLSHGKCWYCEVKESRSDKAVDHFRPKNRVAECDDHEGYWWLAFDSSNYRFSCTFCNSRRVRETTSGGKQDHFPLLDEIHRAKTATDDILLEKPILIDPTNVDDISLLWFYKTGMPTPAVDEDQNAIKYKRAKESIRLYHLDEEDIVENRQDLYVELEKKVARANVALDDVVRAIEPTVKANALQRFRDEAKDIQQAVSVQAELSGAARIFLRTIAETEKIDWLNKLLSRTS